MTILEELVQRRQHHTPRLIGQLAGPEGLVFQSVTAAAGPWVCVHGRWVLNFAASNYLGLSQDPRVAAAMARAAMNNISLGMPRALGSVELTRSVERAIADLVGQEDALVYTSTSHVARDVLGLLGGREGMFFLDRNAYPISFDAAIAVGREQRRLLRFAHNDVANLEQLLQRYEGASEKVIVCDGIYPIEGRMAALRGLSTLADRCGAALYVDDAHGVGLLGHYPSSTMPLGHGGGGTPRRLGLKPGNFVHVGSLSKALGVPVAFAAGPRQLMEYLRVTSPAFVHTSPPATPLLAAALSALSIHDREGDDRRERLVAMVRRFRAGLRCVGRSPEPATLFPVQSLRLPNSAAAMATALALRRQGIWPLLQMAPPDQPRGGALRFVLTALHRPEDIDQAIDAIARAWPSSPEQIEAVSNVGNRFQSINAIRGTERSTNRVRRALL